MSGAAASEIAVTPSAYAPELEAAIAAPQPLPLADLRRRAAARFAELGFPNPRGEDWRFTNVAPVAKIRFRRPAPGFDRSAVARSLAPFRLAGAHELVFVDGRFAA